MKINICFGIDDAYAQHTGAVISSILENSSKEDEYNFYIISDGISKENKKKFNRLKKNRAFKISYLNFDTNILKKLDFNNSEIHYSGYFRLWAIDLIKQDKVLYLDSDLIVRKDLRELYKTDISNYLGAAVSDPMTKELCQSLATKYSLNSSYMNSGVILLNLKRCREEGINQKLLYFLKENHDLITGYQDAINIVMQKRIKELDQKWNCINSIESKEKTKTNKCGIIHWATLPKPWNLDIETFKSDEYFKYLKLTPWSDDFIKIALKKEQDLEDKFNSDLGDRNEYLALLNNSLASVAFKKNDYKQALLYFEKALEFSNLFHKTLKTQHKFFDSFIRYKKSEIYRYKIIDNIVNICSELAKDQFTNRNYEESLIYYLKLVKYDTKDPLLFFKIGLCLNEFKDTSSAIKFLEKALEESNDNLNIVNYLSMIYETGLNDIYKAIECYEKNIKKMDEDKIPALAYYEIGDLYRRFAPLENVDKQINYFTKAIKIAPKMWQALRGLASAYTYIGEYQNAIDNYEKLFEISPKNNDYYNYAFLKFKTKSFKDNWKYYSHRFLKEIDPVFYPQIEKPLWNGEGIQDKTLLVQCEQSLGYSIMCCRYLYSIKPLTGKVILRVQDELVELMKQNQPNIEVVGLSTKIDNLTFDYHVPFMDLIKILDPNFENIPLTDGYLKADEDKFQNYRKKFFNKKWIKIGIAYENNKMFKETYDISNEVFKELISLNKVCIYHLIKDDATKKINVLDNNGNNITSLSFGFNDFTDVPAFIQNLDLFISSDSELLDLAGAMNKKSYLLLEKETDWRWFENTDKTEWYSSVKILKKTNINQNYGDLIEQLTDEIYESIT